MCQSTRLVKGFHLLCIPLPGAACAANAQRSKRNRLQRGGVWSVDRHLAEPSRGLRKQRFWNALHLPVLAGCSFTAGLKLFRRNLYTGRAPSARVPEGTRTCSSEPLSTVAYGTQGCRPTPPRRVSRKLGSKMAPFTVIPENYLAGGRIRYDAHSLLHELTSECGLRGVVRGKVLG
jgi:hypothetical protein